MKVTELCQKQINICKCTELEGSILVLFSKDEEDKKAVPNIYRFKVFLILSLLLALANHFFL